MQPIEIGELTFENFGPYSGSSRLVWAQPRLNAGPSITLAGGVNGSGKSTILEAISLALYGRRSPAVRRQGFSYGEYLRSAIHKGGPASSLVGVSLTVRSPDASHVITVERSWRLQTRMTDHLEVLLDGKPSPTLAKSWDTYVEQLLPAELSPLFFFDGDQVSAIAESDTLPDPVQRALAKLLGVDLVDQTRADLRAIARRLESTDSNSELETMQDLRVQYAGLQAGLAAAEVELQERREETIAAQRALDSWQDQYLSRGIDLGDSRNLPEVLESLVSSEAEVRAELLSIAADEGPLMLLMEQISAAQLLANQNNRLRQGMESLRLFDELQGELRESLEKMIGVDSDFLVTDVLRVLRLTIQTVIGAEDTERDPSLMPVGPVGLSQLESLRVVLGSLPERVTALVSTLRHLRDERVRAQSALDLSATEESIEAQERLKSAVYHMSECERAEQEAVIRVRDMQQKLVSLEKQLVNVEDRIIAGHRLQRSLEYAVRSEHLLKTFRDSMLRDRASQLEGNIHRALGQLLHKCDLISRVSIDPKDLSIALYDRQGQPLVRPRLSAGERHMLAVAITWGLAISSGYILPVIVDTPLARLDVSHRRTFLTGYLLHCAKQILVLSTDSEVVGPYEKLLEGWIHQRYLIRHDVEKGASRIEQGYFAG